MSTVKWVRVGDEVGTVEVVGEGMFPKRLEILRLLARRSAAGELAPSIQEIGAAVGLGSSQTVHHHLRKLKDGGYVEREGRARDTRLTERGWEAVGELPMLGGIAAGPGIEAVGVDEVYSLFGDLLSPRSGKRRFLLTARGQSMVGAGIGDGDTLIMEEDEAPPDGTAVAALLRGEEVTVKWLYREGDLVRLKPDNAAFDDIVLAAEDVRIQGRVHRVLHPPRR
jgi:repressor LexA